MKNSSQKLVRASILLALCIAIQFIGRTFPVINQFLVGPIINAILLITAWYCGIWYGVAVGTLTPLMAFLVGQLPSPMMPFIPFIMIGNIIFVVIFGILMKKSVVGKGIGVGIGSVCKFAFLYMSALKLVPLFKIGFKAKVYKNLVFMMGFPQLITAIIGGIIAIIIISLMKKRITL